MLGRWYDSKERNCSRLNSYTLLSLRNNVSPLDATGKTLACASFSEYIGQRWSCRGEEAILVGICLVNAPTSRLAGRSAAPHANGRLTKAS